MFPSRAGRVALLGFGILLVATGALPAAGWFLDPVRGGVPARAAADLMRALWPSVLAGSLIVALAASIGAWMGARRGAGASPGPASWATGADLRRGLCILACASVATGGALAAHHLVHRGHPTLLDEMVQLADARVFPGALEMPDDPAFRVLRHGRVVGPESGAAVDGWVSMYPPGHTVVLTARLTFGHVVIALVWGAAVAAAAALFFLLLPPRPALAAGGFLAVSPFGWLVAGGAMSHVSAALGVSLAALGAVASAGADRTRSAIGWAAVVGLGAGVAVTARPLTGLALGVAFPMAVWIVDGAGGRAGGLRRLGLRAVGATASGLPFALFLARVQAARFGHPLLTGYEATFGPDVRPGFRVDAWGNVYDLPAAVGMSAADLFLAGIAALETPMPLGVAIGIGLLVLAWRGTATRSSVRAPLVLAAWIAFAVAANATYWHHGYHLGPRMMFETLPAWFGLAAWTGWRLLERGGAWRGAVTGAGAVMLLGALVFGIPTRLASARVSDGLAAQVRIDPPPADAGIVFLHGSSSRRAVAKLQALGMRADSVESAIRRNDLCDVTAWANAHRAGRGGEAPTLDFDRLPGSPPDIVQIETGPGLTARFRAGADGRVAIDEDCLADVVRPDAAGTLELDPLLWRLEDPSFTEADVLWVRDLGPVENAALIAARPGQAAYMVTPDADGRAVYEPYVEAMARIWGVAPE